MTGLVLLALTAAPLDGGTGAPDGGRTFVFPSLAGALGASRPGHGETACASCHATSSWTDVRFNHERTGFPLTGRHQRASCKGCHQKDFKTPLARGCVGCHRDVHAGDLGVRCEGCHDTGDWRSRFDADAHRRSNFPLFGAHAGLPCVECHVEARERRFTRATVECIACHQQDTVRTRGTAVDHAALGFDARECRQCHGPLRFPPALLPDHDRCFPINGGAHAGIGCGACHTSLRAATTSGSCRTGTAACTSCHEHECTPGSPATETDRQHANVAGYACQSQRCYGCHQPMGARP